MKDYVLSENDDFDEILERFFAASKTENYRVFANFLYVPSLHILNCKRKKVIPAFWFEKVKEYNTAFSQEWLISGDDEPNRII